MSTLSPNKQWQLYIFYMGMDEEARMPFHFRFVSIWAATQKHSTGDQTYGIKAVKIAQAGGKQEFLFTKARLCQGQLHSRLKGGQESLWNEQCSEECRSIQEKRQETIREVMKGLNNEEFPEKHYTQSMQLWQRKKFLKETVGI